MTVDEARAMYGTAPSAYFRGTAKPYVRWWWLAGPFTPADVARQLRWVREAGFGGVELAWIYPSWFEEDPGLRPEWLGPVWTELVTYTKRAAEELGLGCDFTFGSCWPFGGSWVGPQNAAQTFTGPSQQRLGCSWEQPADSARVLNHLSAEALERYARPLLNALSTALEGSMSALFCDSLELQTEGLWSEELWQAFEQRFGYSLRPFAGQLDENPQVRYDYRRLIADTIGREFYQAFTKLCRRDGAYSRVQCHGAPTDLLAAYAAADVPESEALLFSPVFSRISASAAAWAGKPIVSAEAFTCIYGFPGWDDGAETYWREENIHDLRLLADSLFAQGVNQIVWHGMPFQPAGGEMEFYAAVHVGPDSVWAAQLPAFNKYLEEVSALMRLGRPYGGLGVYLPFEDALMEDRIAEEERTPGANYRWEMRHARPPAETEGFHPLWISEAFLSEARVENGLVCSRELALLGLYVDCEWLDEDALRELVRLAQDGATIICKQNSKCPGQRRDRAAYERNLETLADLSKTVTYIDGQQLLRGQDLPPYWARVQGERLLLFFAHPTAKTIGYPMEYGSGRTAGPEQRGAILRWRAKETRVQLSFAPGASTILLVDAQGAIQNIQTSEF